MARLCGAEVAVVGLERDTARLAVTQYYGCTPLVADAEDWIRATDGYGVDGVIDATGVSAALQMAMHAVRPAGWISKVGWGPQPLDFSLDPLVQKNVRLQGSFSHNWPIWERVIRLLSTGQLDVTPIVGGRWPLESWQAAFETLLEAGIVKAILQP
jgi:alcohol dehydrogenase/L-iditol 2-dehydrogenase